MGIYRIVRPLIFALGPARGRRWALKALKVTNIGMFRAIGRELYRRTDPSLESQLWGLRFENPIGLAAGFDVDGAAPLAWAVLGFGFAELGTVTARPQPGWNARRSHRIPAALALTYSASCPNIGARYIAERLTYWHRKKVLGEIALGINLGRSPGATFEKAVQDILTSFQWFYPLLDYFVINIIPPGRNSVFAISDPTELAAVLGRLQAVNERGKPILLKLFDPPEIAESQELIAVSLKGKIQGIIVTSVSLDGATASARAMAGAPPGHRLGGRPLAAPSLEALRTIYRQVQGQVPLISGGGVFTAADVYARIRSGAHLVQLYTALVYRGPSLLRKMCRGLALLLDRDGLITMTEAIGVDVT